MWPPLILYTSLAVIAAVWWGVRLHEMTDTSCAGSWCGQGLAVMMYPAGAVKLLVEPRQLAIDGASGHNAGATQHCSGRLGPRCIAARLSGSPHDWERGIKYETHLQWLQHDISAKEASTPLTNFTLGLALAARVTDAVALEELDASAVLLTTAGLEAAVPALVQHPRLTTLALRMNVLDAAAAGHLAVLLQGSKTLSKLDLWRNYMMASEVAGRVLGNGLRRACAPLTWLSLADIGPDSEAPAFVRSLVPELLAANEGACGLQSPAITRLRYLSLHSTSIEDSGAVALAELLAHPDSALEELDLTFTGLTGAGAESIAAGITARYADGVPKAAMKVVRLVNNRLQPATGGVMGMVDAFRAAAQLRCAASLSPGSCRAPILEVLDISMCQMGSEGGDALGRLANVGITELNIRSNPLGSRGVVDLAARLVKEHDEAVEAAGSRELGRLTLKRLLVGTRMNPAAHRQLAAAGEYAGIEITGLE